MVRLSTLFLLAGALFAQTGKDTKDPQVPPDVDQALRARITEFLNYHIRGEFRKAEALVAEDSKDIFYNRDKPRYMSCSGISSIRYSENFTKAYATVQCTVPMMIQPGDNEQQADGQPQVPMGPPTVPIPMMWKLEDGKWCWYVDKDLDRRSPFGLMPAAPVAPGMAPGAVLPMVNLPPGMSAPPPPQTSSADPAMVAAIQAASHVPATAASIGAVPPEALHHVKLAPADVKLKAGGTVQVKISNDAEDSRLLMLLGQLPGVEAKLDATKVDGGQSVNLKLKAAAGAKSGTLNVVVVSTGEMLPLQIKIQ